MYQGTKYYPKCVTGTPSFESCSSAEGGTVPCFIDEKTGRETVSALLKAPSSVVGRAGI